MRTEDAAEKSKVGRTGAATGAVLVDHTTLECLGQRHSQKDGLVELSTSRLEGHDWTDRHPVTADVSRNQFWRHRKYLTTTQSTTL